MNQRQVVDLNLATSRDSRTSQAVRGQDLPTDEPLEFLADDEQTLSDSTIMVLGLDSGESVDLMGGVNLQCQEGVQGIDITQNNQQVVPLDDGSFEVVTLEQPCSATAAG